MLNHKFLLSLVTLALLLAACSPAKPADSPVLEDANFPTGGSAPSGEADSEFPIGRFNGNDEAIQYNPDGTFEFYTVGSDPLFIGQYKVDGNLITSINPNETDPKCQGEVVYNWTFLGNKLTFWPTTDDQCRGRREANADTYTYDPTFLPEIRVSALDFSYIAPLKVRSGWVRAILKNTGNEPHHVQFLRLIDGVTVDQFEEALNKAEGPALAMAKQVGGVGVVAPGMEAQAVINLPAGEYVILCLIPSASDHVAHHAKGMVKGMTVLDTNGHGIEPSADLTVRMKDFTFDMPDSISSGPLTVQVINDGPEAHEFNILQLAEGKTLEDVVQFLNGAGGPPPFTPVGGMNGLDMGAAGFAELNLQPGTYVAICNIPSPKAEGHPHFTLGMVRQFTVAP